MFKNSFMKLQTIQNFNHFNKTLKIFKFPLRGNFDQFKDRPKRSFMLLYRYVEDMHYKRSIFIKFFSKCSSL
jgi:hypothetical protein